MFNYTNRKESRATVSESATTLIAQGTEIRGDIRFSGPSGVDFADGPAGYAVP